MLKKLHDAATAVLKLRDGQHSLAEEIAAYDHLAAVNADAAAEIKAARKAAPKKPAAKTSSASTKKA